MCGSLHSGKPENRGMINRGKYRLHPYLVISLKDMTKKTVQFIVCEYMCVCVCVYIYGHVCIYMK
jgi:hypothetical protein